MIDEKNVLLTCQTDLNRLIVLENMLYLIHLLTVVLPFDKRESNIQ